MSLRIITSLFLLLFCHATYAASCESVFPSGFNIIGSGADPFENIPNNNSTDSLYDGIVVPKGDNFYLFGSLGNHEDLYISSLPSNEKTSRIYIGNSVNWHNANINEGGDPEDVIIYISGTLSISGGNTDINAIIYVAGAVSQSGNGADISGAITAGAGSANVDYDEEAITNADFNELCGSGNDAYLPYPYSNGFESGDDEWETQNEWEVTTSEGIFTPSQGNYHLTYNIYSIFNDTLFTTLTPFIQLPESTDNSIVSFDYFAAQLSGSGYTSAVNLQIQAEGGEWQTLSPINQANAEYENLQISLAGYDGLAVRFRFSYTVPNLPSYIRFLIFLFGQIQSIAIDNFYVGPDTNQENPEKYLIALPNSALTCDVAKVSLMVCSDESCTTPYDQSVTLDLLGNGNELTLIENNIPISSRNITIDGTRDVYIQHTTPENLLLTLENTPNSDPLVECSLPSCTISFADAGFRFLYGNNDGDIGAQVAGETFKESVKIQAVKDNNGVCEGIFTNNVNIQLAKQLASPSTEGLPLTTNATNIPTLPNYSAHISLNFGNNSTAEIPNLTYDDAGQISLNAFYSDGNISLQGSSNLFWVQPKYLALSAKSGATALTGNNASASIIHPAGVPFDFVVEAKNSKGQNTTNYQPGTTQLAVNRLLPLTTNSNSVEGTFSYANSSSINTETTFTNANLTDFSSGKSTYSGAMYDEVGVIEVDIQDINYGDPNSPLIIEATPIVIGRFTPDHYQQIVLEQGSTVNNFDSSIISVCNAEQNFVYSGQRNNADSSQGSIRYNPVLIPEIRITAYNQQGLPTLNYLDDLVKLNDSSIGINIPSADNVALGTDNNPLPVTGAVNAGTLESFDGTNDVVKGSVHYQLSTDDHFYYLRSTASIVEPFTTNFDLVVNNITDTDGIGATSTEDITPAGLELRFARLVVDNSYGPETSNLRQSLQSQYLKNGQYINNGQDNCSQINVSQASLVSNGSLLTTDTSVSGNNGVMQSGYNTSLHLTLSNKAGEIEVHYNAPTWLKFDWLSTGSVNQNPQAVATFGQYRGNDRVIHWREKGD